MDDSIIQIRAVGPLTLRDGRFTYTTMIISGRLVRLETFHCGWETKDVQETARTRNYALGQRRRFATGSQTLNLATHGEWFTLVNFAAGLCGIEPPVTGDVNGFYEPEKVEWQRR